MNNTVELDASDDCARCADESDVLDDSSVYMDGMTDDCSYDDSFDDSYYDLTDNIDDGYEGSSLPPASDTIDVTDSYIEGSVLFDESETRTGGEIAGTIYVPEETLEENNNDPNNNMDSIQMSLEPHDLPRVPSPMPGCSKDSILLPDETPIAEMLIEQTRHVLGLVSRIHRDSVFDARLRDQLTPVSELRLWDLIPEADRLEFPENILPPKRPKIVRKLVPQVATKPTNQTSTKRGPDEDLCTIGCKRSASTPDISLSVPMVKPNAIAKVPSSSQISARAKVVKAPATVGQRAIPNIGAERFGNQARAQPLASSTPCNTSAQIATAQKVVPDPEKIQATAKVVKAPATVGQRAIPNIGAERFGNQARAQPLASSTPCNTSAQIATAQKVVPDPEKIQATAKVVKAPATVGQRAIPNIGAESRGNQARAEPLASSTPCNTSAQIATAQKVVPDPEKIQATAKVVKAPATVGQRAIPNIGAESRGNQARAEPLASSTPCNTSAQIATAQKVVPDPEKIQATAKVVKAPATVGQRAIPNIGAESRGNQARAEPLASSTPCNTSAQIAIAQKVVPDPEKIQATAKVVKAPATVGQRAIPNIVAESRRNQARAEPLATSSPCNNVAQIATAQKVVPHPGKIRAVPLEQLRARAAPLKITQAISRPKATATVSQGAIPKIRTESRGNQARAEPLAASRSCNTVTQLDDRTGKFVTPAATVSVYEQHMPQTPGGNTIDYHQGRSAVPWRRCGTSRAARLPQHKLVARPAPAQLQSPAPQYGPSLPPAPAQPPIDFPAQSALYATGYPPLEPSALKLPDQTQNALQQQIEPAEKVVCMEIYYKLINVFPNVDRDYVKRLCPADWTPGDRDAQLATLVEMILEGGDAVPKISVNEYAERESNVQTSSPDDVYENLLGIFPDADPHFLRDFAEKNGAGADGLKQFVERNLEQRDYPTREQYMARLKITEQQRQYTHGFDVKQFLSIIPDPAKHFTDPKRNCRHSTVAFEFLKSHFNKMRVNTISKAYNLHRFNMTLTAASLEKNGSDLRSRRCGMEMPTEDIQLLQEIAYIKHKTEISNYIANAKETEENEFKILKAQNLLLECQCCFDAECVPSKCGNCENGHIFCNECVINGTNAKLGDGDTHINCFINCGSEFSLSVLQQVLAPTTFSILLQKRQAAEVMEAGLEGLVSCPFCHFASIPPEGDKVFKCLNPECTKESCRLCKELSHVPLKCDEVMKADKARLYIEEKMTAALARTCYKCQKSFFKEEGCNKITCVCGAIMCYLCDQPIKDYSHFRGQGSDDQTRCPLYSDTIRLDAVAVRKVAEQAQLEVLKRNPNVKIDTRNLLPAIPRPQRGPHQDVLNADELPRRAQRVIDLPPM